MKDHKIVNMTLKIKQLIKIIKMLSIFALLIVFSRIALKYN